MKQQKQNKQDPDFWIRICLLPLIIGFSLVIANITMIIFKVIGWVLLIFGIITGVFYIKIHKEKILKILRKVFSVKEGY